MVVVVETRLIPGQGREAITLMDDFGTEHQIYVPVSDAANRQAFIDEAVTRQTANETALKVYAEAHGIDITEEIAAGATKRLAKN